MDEFGVRPLCPTPRGGVDLIWKDADGNRDGDVLRGEKGKLVFPIQTSRRDRRVRQPVEGDVVENVISRKALGLAGKEFDASRPREGVSSAAFHERLAT